MRIYLICSVRNGVDPSAYEYVIEQERKGNYVHFPKMDADQSDPIGIEICKTHRKAMQDSDEVHVLWDETSYGSHFDLGMAFAMGKPIKYIGFNKQEKPGKSYYKVIQKLHNEYFNSNS